MIVVDTNVIAYAWLNTAHTQRARALMRFESEWHAPLLWRSEFRNVLIGEVRRERIEDTVANEVMQSAERWFAGHEHLPLSPRVIELASESGCTAYDCEFVAAAEQLNTLLVTMDGTLLKAFPQCSLSLDAACERRGQDE